MSYDIHAKTKKHHGEHSILETLKLLKARKKIIINQAANLRT